MEWNNKRGLFIFPFFLYLFFILSNYGICQDLLISNQGDFYKDILSFQISANSAPNEVYAFGFDLSFDPFVLEYIEYSKSDLIKDYQIVDCIQLEPGKLRCGGLTTGEGHILKGQKGEIINLSFRKIGCQKTTLCLTNLVDDMENWVSEEGQFFCINKKREK